MIQIVVKMHLTHLLQSVILVSEFHAPSITFDARCAYAPSFLLKERGIFVLRNTKPQSKSRRTIQSMKKKFHPVYSLKTVY